MTSNGSSESGCSVFERVGAESTKHSGLAAEGVGAPKAEDVFPCWCGSGKWQPQRSSV
jgi:hypothetical protein